MINVSVDVAGMYYRPTQPVQVAERTTVLKALEAVRDRDIMAYLAEGKEPIFDFSIETGPSKGLFINEISIIHAKDAVSGQSDKRTYRAGRYAYADDPVTLAVESPAPPPPAEPKMRLARNDDSALPYVLAWQYYLYGRVNGKFSQDLGRSDDGKRKVEPVSEKVLMHDTLIVWRLIAIFVKPTEEAGIKKLFADDKRAAIIS